MADGGWRMADGGWRMADGGWRMADGEEINVRSPKVRVKKCEGASSLVRTSSFSPLPSAICHPPSGEAAIRHQRSRSQRSRMPSHFVVHPAGDHLEDHHVVGGEGIERVAERRGLVVLDEEVAVPGEGVADDGRGEEEPGADGDAEDDAGEGER